MSGSSKWSLSLNFPHQNPVYTSRLYMSHIASRAHYSWSEHQNNIWWGTVHFYYKAWLLSSASCSGRIRFDSCSLYPQNEIGPSISSSVVLCTFVLLVYIVKLVLVVYFCPSSVHVVTIFAGTLLSPLLCSVLPFFPLMHWFSSLSSFVIPRRCLKNGVAFN